MHARSKSSQVTALAVDCFEKFCNADSLDSAIQLHKQMCQLINVKPNTFPNFFPKVMATLRTSDAQDLLSKYSKRAAGKAYENGQACAGLTVLIIGAGPCGLRTAIEAQLAGAKVVVVEKRDGFSRNNVLHLWPFVIADLKNLGAKRFYGKFCPGAIDHISIAKLQFMLLKVALLVGVEVHFSVGFEDLVEPCEDEGGKKRGWRIKISPEEHPVSAYEFDAVIGADGKRNTLKGFHRKVLRGKLAIAITANFVNSRTAAEAKVQEISGVSFIYKQDFFNELCQRTGIDLENIVYYKDETHYFVMTAKKHSLLWKGVLCEDFAETDQLLAPSNVNKEALLRYVTEAVNYATNNQLPELQFAMNYRGEPDVAIIDFTAMHAAESACRVVERRGHKILLGLVGDSLLEPFWPTGSGCARGFLSSMDACWMLRSWAKKSSSPLEVIAERESIYRLLAQTTHENLSKDHNHYTIEPLTRYPHINCNTVKSFQVQGLLDSDANPAPKQSAIKKETERIETSLKRSKTFCSSASRGQKMQNRYSAKIPTLDDDSDDELPDLDQLLNWFREQVKPYGIQVDGIQDVFVKGDILCAILHRFRPDLLPEFPLPPEVQQGNSDLEQAGFRNQLAFDFVRGEYFIPCKISGMESVQNLSSNLTVLISYAVKIYETFRHQKPRGIVKPRLSIDDSDNTQTSEEDLKNESKKRDDDAFFTPPESPTPDRERSETPSYVTSVWASTTTFFDPEEQERTPGRKVQRSSSIQRMVQRLDQNQANPSPQSSTFRKCPSPNPPTQEELRKKRLEEAETTKVEALKMIHQLQSHSAEKRHDEQAEARQRFIRAMRAQQSTEPPETPANKKTVEEDEFFNEYNMRLWRSSRPSMNERTQFLEKQLLNTGLERKASLRETPVKNQLLVNRGLQRSATEAQMKTTALPAHVQKFRNNNPAVQSLQQKMNQLQGTPVSNGKKSQPEEHSSSSSSDSSVTPTPETSPAPSRSTKITESSPRQGPQQIQKPSPTNPMKTQFSPGKLTPQQLKLQAPETKQPVKPEAAPSKLQPQQLNLKQADKKPTPPTAPKFGALPGKLSPKKLVPESSKPRSSLVPTKPEAQVTKNIKSVVTRTEGIKKSFSTTHMPKQSTSNGHSTAQNGSGSNKSNEKKKNDFSEYFAAKAAAEAKAAERQAKRNERKLAQEARRVGQPQVQVTVSESPEERSDSGGAVRSYALCGSQSFHQLTSTTPLTQAKPIVKPSPVASQSRKEPPQRVPQPYTRQTTLEEFDALLDITEEDEKILQELDPAEIDHLLDWTTKTIDVSAGVDTF